MNTVSEFFAIMVDTALKTTVLMILAWGAGRLLKNRSSASRHLIRTCALCAALLLAPLSSLLPAWKVQGVPQLRPDTSSVSTEKLEAPVVSSSQGPKKIEFSPNTKPRRVREKMAAGPEVAVVAPQQPVASATIQSNPAVAGS